MLDATPDGDGEVAGMLDETPDGDGEADNGDDQFLYVLDLPSTLKFSSQCSSSKWSAMENCLRGSSP